MLSTNQTVFFIGDEEFSLDIMDVIAVEKIITTEPVSSLSQNFIGVISLRGDIIPVYSLRRKFHMADLEQDDNTRYVITKTDGMLIAYEVDKMSGIIQLTKDQLNEVPSIIKVNCNGTIKGIAKVDNRLIVSLDKDGLLSEEELNQVKAVINKTDK